MKNVQRGFIGLILIIVIAVAAVGGGVYIYQKQKIDVDSVKITSTLSSTTASSLNELSVRSSTIPGWILFSTTSIPVAFEYPEKWGSAKVEYGSSISFSNSQFLIEYRVIQDFEDNPIIPDLNPAISQESGEIKLGKIITAGGKKGIIRYYQEGSIIVQIPVGDGNTLTVYHFGLTDEDTLDKLLSTVHFDGKS